MGKYKYGLINAFPAGKLSWSNMRLKYGSRSMVPAVTTVDYLSGLPKDLGVMGNADYGDCYWAAIGHGDQIRTKFTTGTMVTQPADTILKWYSDGTGFNKNDPSTDQGSDPLSCFNYIEENGLLRADGSTLKLLGVFEIDPRNTGDIMEAMDAGLGVMTGFSVPQSLEDDMDKSVWQYVPSNSSIVGGHEVLVAKQLSPTANRGLISWGRPTYEMEPDFWDAFVTQCTVCVWSDTFAATGKSPFGMTEEQMVAEMQAIQSGSIS